MKVKCDNQELELPTGSSAKELAERMNLREPHQALAVPINGKQYDLDAQLSDGDDVKLLDFESEEGKEVYRYRKMTVEPVFGIIKQAMGFRRFSFRGGN